MASLVRYQWEPACAYTGKNQNQAPRVAALRVIKTQISRFRHLAMMLVSRSKSRPCSRRRRNRSLPRVLSTSRRSQGSSKTPQKTYLSSQKGSKRSRMFKAQLKKIAVHNLPWNLLRSKMKIRANEAKTNHCWKALGRFARKTPWQTLTTPCE